MLTISRIKYILSFLSVFKRIERCSQRYMFQIIEVGLLKGYQSQYFQTKFEESASVKGIILRNQLMNLEF